MYKSVRGNRTYGEFKRFIREAIPRSERRKLDTSLKRDGIGFAERRRIITLAGVLLAGVIQGTEEARRDPLNLFH